MGRHGGLSSFRLSTVVLNLLIASMISMQVMSLHLHQVYLLPQSPTFATHMP